jgi:hypothetical protein
MTPAELMDRCRGLGIDLDAGPDGTLVWQADDDPPADLLEDVAHIKSAVLTPSGRSRASPVDKPSTTRAVAGVAVTAAVRVAGGRGAPLSGSASSAVLAVRPNPDEGYADTQV